MHPLRVNWTTYVNVLLQDATLEGPVRKKDLGTAVESLRLQCVIE